MTRKDLIEIYNVLYRKYGTQHWWPGETPWEVCVGAVLTQNTNWSNVEKSITFLKQGKLLYPEKIFLMATDKLEEAIRSSGYYRLKAQRLRAVTEWWLKNVRNNQVYPTGRPVSFWRDSILKVKGVGPETADSILLYCFNMPVFVVDAYTKRIMARHFGIPEHIDYQSIQELFMKNLPADAQLFNEFHALFVRLAKEDCKKNQCMQSCPLRDF